MIVQRKPSKNLNITVGEALRALQHVRNISSRSCLCSY